MTSVLNRGALVRKCRELEQRSLRVGHIIGVEWSQQWAAALLDTRCPPALYANWIGQLDDWLTRKEARS